MYWILILLPIGYFWFRLVNNLWPEWMTDPQYSYGLLVPLLCVGLLIRRWTSFTGAGRQQSEVASHRLIIFLFAILAFLYLPTRLIEAATPEWRPLQWLLGLETIGLTLCAIDLGKGRSWLKQLAFPVCFFFVAIPWPSYIETPIIQTLTHASAVIVIEVMNWIGVPAEAHGNIIEVSTGMVGINEACSGIRSFQTSLMICLFLGEFYRLSSRCRWLLIPTGFGLSFGFNVCRIFLLTMIAAKKGVPAVSQFHDPAGVSTAIFCTLSLWGIAVLLKKKALPVAAETKSGATEISTAKSANPSTSGFASPTLRQLSLSLLVWLVVVEVGVQLWYDSREALIKPGPDWTLNFPSDNPSLKDLPMDDATRNLLRFDEGKQAEWNEPDGTKWQAFYFNWLPGRVAGFLAKRHTPEICLEATGMKLIAGPKLEMMNIHGVNLPIRCYTFEDTKHQLVQVFHCRWEAGAGNDTYVENESDRFNLVRAVWTGRGNKGQKVLEFAVYGQNDSEAAKQAFIHQLEQSIIVEKPATTP